MTEWNEQVLRASLLESFAMQLAFGYKYGPESWEQMAEWTDNAVEYASVDAVSQLWRAVRWGLG